MSKHSAGNGIMSKHSAGDKTGITSKHSEGITNWNKETILNHQKYNWLLLECMIDFSLAQCSINMEMLRIFSCKICNEWHRWGDKGTLNRDPWTFWTLTDDHQSILSLDHLVTTICDMLGKKIYLRWGFERLVTTNCLPKFWRECLMTVVGDWDSGSSKTV